MNKKNVFLFGLFFGIIINVFPEDSAEMFVRIRDQFVSYFDENYFYFLDCASRYRGNDTAGIMFLTITQDNYLLIQRKINTKKQIFENEIVFFLYEQAKLNIYIGVASGNLDQTKALNEKLLEMVLTLCVYNKGEFK